MPSGHYIHRQSERSQKWVIEPGDELDLDDDPHVWVYPDGPGDTYSVTYTENKVFIEFADAVSTGTVVMMTDEFMDRTIVWEECEMIEKERAMEEAVRAAQNLLTKHSTG